MSGDKLNTRQEFTQGFVDSIPIIFAASPFGLVFGAAAIASGLDGYEAMFASALMYAGASQFVFIEVNGLNVPAWSILLAVFAVNFRHVLYSASLSPKMKHFSFLGRYASFFLLTDPAFAAGEHRSETRELAPAYFLGYGFPLYLIWIIATGIGVVFGGLIEDPTKFGFDFLLPIYFLTLLMGFRTRRRWLPIVLISGIASAILFKLVGPPWHISLGALIGICFAACMPLEAKEDAPPPSSEGEG